MMLENELGNLNAVNAAARLLGCDLIRTIDGRQLIGRIVETEAYDESDQASHSYRGRTERNLVMFGTAAKAYIYFTYGMHYCLNVSVGPIDHGAAVLIRAMEPIAGVEHMIQNRNNTTIDNLLNGPAKICQAFKIDKTLNGHDLNYPPLVLRLNRPVDPSAIAWSARIGIREKGERILEWRAVISTSNYLSRPL